MATYYIPTDFTGGTILVNEGDVFIFESGASNNVQFQSASGSPTNFSVEFTETNTNGITVQIPSNLNGNVTIADNVNLSNLTLDASGSNSLTMDIGDNVTLNEFKGSNNEDTITIGDNFTTFKDFKLGSGDDLVFVGENASIPSIDAQTGNDTIASMDTSLVTANAETVAYPDGIVAGSTGADAIGAGYQDSDYDAVDGWDGDSDTIYARGGDDTVAAGAGDDIVYGDRAILPPDPAPGADIQIFNITNGDIGGGGRVIYDIGANGDNLLLNDVSITDTASSPIGEIQLRQWGDDDGQPDVVRIDLSTFNDDFTIENFNDRADDTIFMIGVQSETDNGDGTFTYTYIGSDDALHTVTVDPRLASVEAYYAPGVAGDDSIDGGAGDDALYGDAGDDTLDGGSGSDSILGGDGDDVFERSGGNNTLDGGAGSDFFEIGLGNDTVIGGETGSDQDTLSIADSNDAIDITFTGDAVGTYLDGDGDSGAFSQIEVFELSDNADSVDGTADATGFSVLAGSGADTIIGGAGNDTIAGGDGDDYIEGGAGDDVLTTGLGQDTLVGGEGNDTLMNSDGDDLLIGGAGDDSIVATGGQDTLVGGTGADTMEGGDDADTFIIEDSFGNDVIIGGEGTTDPSDVDFDTIDLSQLTGPVTVTYTGDDAGTITDGTDTITFSEIERVILTERADLVDASSDIAGTQIVAGDGDDTVIGGAGSDTIDAGAGADTVQGEDGADEIYGGSGNDTLFGNRGSDTLYGGDGDDSIEGGNAGDWGRGSGDNASSHDFVDGGAGNDTIGGGDGDDTIFGGAGDDIINGNNGDDVLDGGDDADTFVISHSGNDTIVGGEGGNDDDVIDLSQLSGPVTVTYTGEEAGTITDGTDTITFSEIERFILTEFDDSIVGYWGGAHSISGGGGSDTIYGGMGADTIEGGDGADSVWGEDGDDTLLGGAGDDTIGGMAGNDSVEGGEGNDSLRGGGGADTLLGGEGADTLIAGADSDVLDGGAGNDLLTGGDGNDTFTYSVGSGSDTITDFNFGNTGSISDGNGTNNDFIDLSAFYDDIWELHADQADDGILNQSNNGVGGADYSDNAQFGSGSLTFSGASADNTSFTSENTGVVCYAPGTLIDTPTGPRAVETLRPGDLVTTLDHGAQAIRWTHSGDHPLEEVEVGAKPVQIKAGALGRNLPAQDLIVSPQHRILVGGNGQLQQVFATEAFAPAKSLTGAPGIRHMKGKTKITWIHFACDRHEVVTANGCLSESLLLGPMVMNGLSPAERRALTDMFGPAPTPDTALNGPPARDCLTVGAVKRQIAKHLKEKGQLVAKEIKKWDRDLAMEKYEAERMREALTMARAS